VAVQSPGVQDRLARAGNPLILNSTSANSTPFQKRSVGDSKQAIQNPQHHTRHHRPHCQYPSHRPVQHRKDIPASHPRPIRLTLSPHQPLHPILLLHHLTHNPNHHNVPPLRPPPPHPVRPLHARPHLLNNPPRKPRPPNPGRPPGHRSRNHHQQQRPSNHQVRGWYFLRTKGQSADELVPGGLFSAGGVRAGGAHDFVGERVGCVFCFTPFHREGRREEGDRGAWFDGW
jgi:hypothetical protein